ncbi:hypothetical protein BJ741DRAFT_710603 [Chytriomyces cf. hyalinus JEL632]|nr:hypothetical protein BJ741DRAFT_710603 [Chytriomyces cf. hyalinus JEL632]
MPIREDPKEKERERETLSMAVQAYLLRCMQPSTPAYAAVTRSAYWDYIHRITLATTAPVATIHLSLVYTRFMLDALALRDASLLSAFITLPPTELKDIISSKLISLWSLAIILADTAWNDNAFAATSWAQVTVFKLPKAVAQWKAWAGELLDWELGIKDGQFVAFLEGRSDSEWKACCDANRDIAAQNSALLASISERHSTISHDLSRSHLHPTWTIDHYNHQLQQQRQRQLEQQQRQIEQQQQQQQQLHLDQQPRLHQPKRMDSYDSLFSASSSRTATPQLRIYPTPPSNNAQTLFPQRLSSLQNSSSSLNLAARKSLPVLQEHPTPKANIRHRNSRQEFSEYYPTPYSAPIPGPSQQLNSRSSIPRLVIPSIRAQQLTHQSTGVIDLSTVNPRGNAAWSSVSTETLNGSTPVLSVSRTPVSGGSLSRVGSGVSLGEFDGAGWGAVSRNRAQDELDVAFVVGDGGDAAGEELSSSFSDMRILGRGVHQAQRQQDSAEFLCGETLERRLEKPGGALRSLWRDGWGATRDSASVGQAQVQQQIPANEYAQQQQQPQQYRSAKYGDYTTQFDQSGYKQQGVATVSEKLKNGFAMGKANGGTNGAGRVGSWIGSRVWGSGN